MNLLSDEGVDEQYHSIALISTIFTLEHEDDVPQNRSLWKIKKQFVSDVLSKDFETQQKETLDLVYRAVTLDFWNQNDGDNTSFYRLFQDFIMQTKSKIDLFVGLRANQIVYQVTSAAKSVGCQHFLTGCLLRCETCQEFFACQHCHNDSIQDHTFPNKKTTTMKCLYCQEVQPIGLQCCKCNTVLGNQTCPVCRFVVMFSEDGRPFHHCNVCDKCYVGYQDQTRHCDKCNSCFYLSSFDTHICAPPSNCVVCMGELGNTKWGWFSLNCTHQIHPTCYEALLEQGITKCPMCRRFLPIDRDRAKLVRDSLKRLKNSCVRLSDQYDFITVKCLDCGYSFPQMRSRIDEYYCSKCGLFNCEATEIRCTSADFGAHQAGLDPDLRQNAPTLKFFISLFQRLFKGEENAIERVERTIGMKLDESYECLNDLSEFVQGCAFENMREFERKYQEYRAWRDGGE